MSHHDFDRLIAFIRISKSKIAIRERSIRLYCEQMGSVWNLQIRAPISLDHGKEGKDFVIATAALNIEDMRALRSAIDAFLVEAVGSTDNEGG